MADIYMNSFEKRFLIESKHKGNEMLWVRYVDCILIVWDGTKKNLKDVRMKLLEKKRT